MLAGIGRNFYLDMQIRRKCEAVNYQTLFDNAINLLSYIFSAAVAHPGLIILPLVLGAVAAATVYNYWGMPW